MTLLFFFLILGIFSLVLVQLSSNTFVLGLYLLFFCLLTFLLFCFLNMLWYGLLFFLVYIGGVLVLFFYVFSLNPNPNFSNILSNVSSWYILLWFFFICLLLYGGGNLDGLDIFLFSFFEENSFFLFNGVEVYLVFFLGLMLVYVLFMVSIVTSSLKSALRPLSFL
uniref:NADH dehydrogenase subunit 6 n=1 Tax=Arthurdendyus triangulatus TaxID=132421 RepID=UPI002E781106|nr:NADH dehydrogenase subunit 6 [Arthurdendyus triangulatus]WPY71413.1 NADH dehydrogenase subunit 6 [Arthurdendyus triangulatus]